MNFDDYQARTSTTAIYPDAGTGSPTAVSYTIFGLVGEAGELANKYKKVLRDDRGVLTDERRRDLVAELGDVLWYVARLATELGVPLDDVATRNLTKLAARAAASTLTGSGDRR